MFEFKEDKFKEDDWKPLLEMGQLRLSPAANEILGKEEINDLIVRHLYGDFGNQIRGRNNNQ